eukprot:m.65067 g.65067  ORF g.65067 m.65067 type:complete len:73 (-) comp12044_c0_seq1:61-279(-)
MVVNGAVHVTLHAQAHILVSVLHFRLMVTSVDEADVTSKDVQRDIGVQRSAVRRMAHRHNVGLSGQQKAYCI